MLDLKDMENQTINIVREGYAESKKPAVIWSVGKDNATMRWLCRKAFFGKIPFPVIHIDTGYKFKRIDEFRDRIAREWGLDLRIARNTKAQAEGVGPHTSDKLDCCTKLKTEALILARRRDEHGIRAKERYFSPRDEQFKWDYRNQPLEMWDQFQGLLKLGTHMRIHRILHWRGRAAWEYVLQF